jgi:hypothetical protein
MTEQPPSFHFEDVPLDEARCMGRGPRMEPMLYETLCQKIQSFSSEATRIRLGPEIRSERVKNYMHRIGGELNVPVTVRCVPGGVIFWRSSDADIQEANDVASRLQTARQGQTRGRTRRRRTAPARAARSS